MSCAVSDRCTFVINEDGELFSWGRNEYSELGLMGAWPLVHNVGFTTIPTRIRAVGTGVLMVTAHRSRVACVMRDGTVFLWGRGNRFPFPYVDDLAGRDRPLIHVQQDELEGDWATQVVCNQFGWNIVTDSGSVFAGMFLDTFVGPDGHIDDTNEAMRFTSETGELFFRQIYPTVRLAREFFGRQPVKMVAVGTSHVLACGVFCRLWSWGTNTLGCLGRGLGSRHDTRTPTAVPSFETHRVTWVAAGPAHSMAISAGTSGLTRVRRDDAGVYGWGRNESGELGVGYEVAPSYMEQHELQVHLRPVRISPTAFDDDTITMITCAAYCTAAISDTGKMWLWGNTSGMSFETWTVRHALHSRGINVETGRGRARDGAAAQGHGSGAGAGDDSSSMSGSFDGSDDSDDQENITLHRGTPLEFKYVWKFFPQRVLQRHFLGARIVAVVASDSHLAATTEHGYLYMFYGGIIPVLYRPYCTPLDVMLGEPAITSQKQYFGGRALAVRGASLRTDQSAMSRRDVVPYASGRFRSSSEYSAYMANTQRRQQQIWEKQEAAALAAVTAGTIASTAADSTIGLS